MIQYGSPARLAADPAARDKLAQWGRSSLKPPKIEQIIESARTTQGTPINGSEMAWVEEIASELQAAILKVIACKKELELIANTDDSMREYVSAVGAVTLCVIWATVGNPGNYESSGAFLKSFKNSPIPVRKDSTKTIFKKALDYARKGFSRLRQVLR